MHHRCPASCQRSACVRAQTCARGGLKAKQDALPTYHKYTPTPHTTREDNANEEAKRLSRLVLHRHVHVLKGQYIYLVHFH
jgi:hypothetical protein